MSVLYLLVPLALVIVGVAVWAFVWAAGRGQFDDLETPALRMLRDDAPSSRASRALATTAESERSATASHPADSAAPARTTPR